MTGSSKCVFNAKKFKTNYNHETDGSECIKYHFHQLIAKLDPFCLRITADIQLPDYCWSQVSHLLGTSFGKHTSFLRPSFIIT